MESSENSTTRPDATANSITDASVIRLPDASAMIVGAGGALLLSSDGELTELDLRAAALQAQKAPVMLCHRRAMARRLNVAELQGFDLLELFAFVLPAQFCLPTPEGLARVLNLPPPLDAGDRALILQQAAVALLRHLAEKERDSETPRRIAMTMAKAGWLWGPVVLAALGLPDGSAGPAGGLDVWNRLPEAEERAPPPAPSDHPVSAEDAKLRLQELLGDGAEVREQQAQYAAEAATAFQPRQDPGQPRLMLAEAGTGIGKTLGYIASASLWAERNEGTVWISTYTRNLQRQVDQELTRLVPDAAEKAKRVVIRKGRENYLCLYNLEQATGAAAVSQRHAVALGLIARWAEVSRDGDMTGGDFPAWLVDLLGRDATLSHTDHRGECIYSACSHFRRCFIENARRKAAYADIVIANHALVMLRAAMGVDQEFAPPTRFVFDEGHHIFDAADSAFAANLDGWEGGELRRWLLGGEGGGTGGRGSRVKGLEHRIGDLLAKGEDESKGERLLQQVLQAAHVLPSAGWLRRLGDGAGAGPYEAFLAAVRHHVLARSSKQGGGFGLEAGVEEPSDDLLAVAARLDSALGKLQTPLAAMAKTLTLRLDEDAEDLDSGERRRIEASLLGLTRRADLVGDWRRMLRALGHDTPEQFVDWFALPRSDGRETGVGMHRHWVDPTIPFAETLLANAHGVLITSASLRDRPPEAPEDWRAAEIRTGALHLPMVAQRCSLPSPFDYGARTKVFVVTDVRRDDVNQVAAAYRELFKAAGGGGLGLFTAIHRLRAIYQRIVGDLEDAGLPLLAQHVDAMDTGTLVDIFRAEENACLLGTDAVRDGVDVPGRSLRLLVFERVPWPRPDILHKARRKAFGAKQYDDMLTRMRLQQAFGRLLRQEDDKGVFVILDSRMPSRLLTAFPDEVEVARIGLAEAIAATKDFLRES